MSVTAAAGFRAAGVAAGLKPGGALDVAVVVHDGPRQDAAAVFTTNRCVAHPVRWSRQALAGGRARAVLLNSGGANCYTGPAGFALSHASAETVADALRGEGLDVGAAEVQVCSTGLIGVLPDEDALLAGARAAVAALAPEGAPAAAEAIRTTDTVAKQAVVAGPGFTVGGMAKGAGMLAPALATMLVVLTTDADVDSATCDRALRDATRVTFDRLDSDGCTSTNDQVLLMASGVAGVAPSYPDFAAAAHELCHQLAQRLLADAEGAEHEIAIDVRSAASEEEAVEVGRAIARSNLVKAAIFGRDPNWGRVLAAIGTTRACFDPLDLDVTIAGVPVCRASAPAEPADRVDLSTRRVELVVDLHAGGATGTVWTNDLTHEYVRENSAYST